VRHAALPEAREEAVKEAAFWGERWAAQWIYADWRHRGRHVYDEWEPAVHVRHYAVRGPAWYLGEDRLPRPDQVYGLIDWTGGAAPGAVVVCHVWRRNPLAPQDPRPLVVVVAEHQGYEAYTEDGWWGILRDLDRRWGVDRWIGDPHAPALITEAQGVGIWVEPGVAADKAGRIQLVAGMLHHDRRHGILPALYVAADCPVTARQFANYSWRITRSGEIMDKPRDYDDHCLDCLAMLIPELEAGGVWIGREHYVT